MHSSQFSLSLYVSSSLSLRFFLYSGRRQSQWLHKDKKTAPPDRRRAKKEKPGTHNTKSKSEHTKNLSVPAAFILYIKIHFSVSRDSSKKMKGSGPKNGKHQKLIILLFCGCSALVQPSAVLSASATEKATREKKAKMATHH